MNRQHPRRGLLAAALAAAVLGTTGTPAASPLPVGTFADGLRASLLDPAHLPGANDWDCKPPPAHPDPVILVHGTLANTAVSFPALSPVLKNAGYCVFALNYGQDPGPFGSRHIGAVAGIASSAAELAGFVDRVLAATGAHQVDLIGHSQGGMMPNYYIKRLGGAAKVHTFIGLAPSNHGTDLSRLLDFARRFGLLAGFDAAAAGPAPSLTQQERGSAFITALFGDGDTLPGPRYVVIATRQDAVVTPYTQAFLQGPGVRNILIQDQCPKDPTGHLGIVFDGPTLQNVLNALGPNDPDFRAECRDYGMPL
jgi:pimeloyl-ACP methyl ester carboxylesterase